MRLEDCDRGREIKNEREEGNMKERGRERKKE